MEINSNVIIRSDWYLYKMVVERLTPSAQLPVRAKFGDLGYDIFSDESVTIMPQERRLISTGIRVKFPSGWGGQFFDRSGMAWKKGLIVLAGTIDNGYRGELKVLLLNIGDKLAHIDVGDKITQMLPMPVVEFGKIIEGPVSIDDTERGEAGFGSTDAPTV